MSMILNKEDLKLVLCFESQCKESTEGIGNLIKLDVVTKTEILTIPLRYQT